MKTIMRCLVLTLALAVGVFAKYRLVEIPNLDKFQSSRYKIITDQLDGNNYKVVMDTQVDEYEDLVLAIQCPNNGEAVLLKYEFGEEVLVSKAKYPDWIVGRDIKRFCAQKIEDRAKAGNMTEADKEFIRNEVKYWVGEGNPAIRGCNEVSYDPVRRGFLNTIKNYCEEEIKNMGLVKD